MRTVKRHQKLTPWRHRKLTPLAGRLGWVTGSERRTDPDTAIRRVAGLGTTEPHGDFPPLPAVRGELEGIVRRDARDDDGVLPGIVRLDGDFTREALRECATGDFGLLHIATHFDLKPGDDTRSSLLLGTGERLSLRELREMEPRLDLLHVDLVTLSACNTALGGADHRALRSRAWAPRCSARARAACWRACGRWRMRAPAG